jgi:hypothetical protein
MVATDVASRGIGMIDHNPLPSFLTPLFSYLYFLPLTSCGNLCSSLLTVHTACVSCPGFDWSSSQENLASELQFAIGTFWVLCLLTSIKRSEGVSFHHFSKLQFQGFP